MKLSEIFEQLTYGELSQLTMGGWDSEQIAPEDVRKVIAHVNLGLNDLYGRFWLKTGEVILYLYDRISFYKLHNKYAVSNIESTEEIKFIEDSRFYPFQNDVLKIEEVYNLCGDYLCLNDKTKHCSLFTTAYDTIQVVHPFNETMISVQYRAKHPEIKWIEGFDPSTVEVDLPNVMLEPLLLFIGSRSYRALNSDQNQEGNNYFQQYEMACTRLKNLGYEIQTNLTNIKLERNGWV